jgi:hypothetical protein
MYLGRGENLIDTASETAEGEVGGVHDSSMAWSLLNGYLGDVLRYIMWWCVGGFIAMGTVWCGGVAAAEALRQWQSNGPPVRRRQPRDHVRREARRGVRQIEEFLEHQASSGSPG